MVATALQLSRVSLFAKFNGSVSDNLISLTAEAQYKFPKNNKKTFKTLETSLALSVNQCILYSIHHDTPNTCVFNLIPRVSFLPTPLEREMGGKKRDPWNEVDVC